MQFLVIILFAVNFKHTAFAFVVVLKSDIGPKQVSRIIILRAKFPKKMTRKSSPNGIMICKVSCELKLC